MISLSIYKEAKEDYTLPIYKEAYSSYGYNATRGMGGHPVKPPPPEQTSDYWAANIAKYTPEIEVVYDASTAPETRTDAMAIINKKMGGTTYTPQTLYEALYGPQNVPLDQKVQSKGYGFLGWLQESDNNLEEGDRRQTTNYNSLEQTAFANHTPELLKLVGMEPWDVSTPQDAMQYVSDKASRSNWFSAFGHGHSAAIGGAAEDLYGKKLDDQGRKNPLYNEDAAARGNAMKWDARYSAGKDVAATALGGWGMSGVGHLASKVPGLVRAGKGLKAFSNTGAVHFADDLYAGVQGYGDVTGKFNAPDLYVVGGKQNARQAWGSLLKKPNLNKGKGLWNKTKNLGSRTKNVASKAITVPLNTAQAIRMPLTPAPNVQAYEQLAQGKLPTFGGLDMRPTDVQNHYGKPKAQAAATRAAAAEAAKTQTAKPPPKTPIKMPAVSRRGMAYGGAGLAALLGLSLL